MSILASFGVLNPDGTVSNASRTRAIEIYKNFDPYAKNIDLNDFKRYGDWHSQLIDGTIGFSMKTLDIPAPLSTIPVFDPSGVAAALKIKEPPLDLATIIASFAVPQASIPALLNIKPNDIPDFLSNLSNLVKPPPVAPAPVYPELKILSTTGKSAWGGGGTSNYPSQEGFNLAFINALPIAQAQLDIVTKDPSWWASFTPNKLFDTAKQILETVVKPLTQPKTSDPIGYIADLNVALTLASEAMAARTAATTVGATKLLKELGAIKGYVTVADIAGFETKLDREALKNNLYKLQSNEKNMVTLFPRRNMSYGDKYALETIYALSEHMYNDKSYRKSNNEDSVTLEVGNITGNTFVGPQGQSIPKGLGWRINPWSETHGGTAFDMAYPMRDKAGNWMSGIENNNATEIKEFSATPFKCAGGADEPYRIEGKLTHDFAAMYEMGRWLFHEWQINLIEEGRLLPWIDGGQKLVPYRSILIGSKIYKEFEPWAIEKFGNKWNVGHIDKYEKLKWVAGSIFTPANIHEDHMHFQAGRTTIDENLSFKRAELVYRANPSASEKQYRGKKVIKDFGKGPEEVFI